MTPASEHRALDALELKVPPPVVALCVALAMWAVARVVPPVPLPDAVRLGLAGILALAGSCLGVTGIVSFVRAGTTVEPMKPALSCALVRTGVYRISRNPMYLGILLVLLGFGVFLANVASVVLAAAFVAYLDRFQIAPEERVLSANFGAAYDDYRAHVRRWL
jgi:protein-S-isoprenylcysteine O-methyltransferase Ste14